KGDRQVHEHGIQPAKGQVGIRLALAVVNAFLDAEPVEEAFGGGVAERANRQVGDPLAVGETLNPLLASSNYQLQLVDVVRLAEADKLLPVRRALQAVHGKVEVASAEAGDKGVKGILLKFDRPAQLFGQGIRQIDFEADVALRIVGVFEDVGCAAF